MTRRVSLVIVFVLGVLGFGARAYAGSCGSDSDCAGVGKCSNGQCGACGSDSDCNGHGKCSGGKCGACGSDSDCKYGQCSNGKCGSCGSDSDCKGNGKCSSGKCGSCGSDSDCKGGRCSSGRCSNALSAGLDLGSPDDECGDANSGIVRLELQKAPNLSCRAAPAPSTLDAILARLGDAAARALHPTISQR